MTFSKGDDVVSTIEGQILQSKVLERIQQVQQQHPDTQQQYFEIQLGQERRRRMEKLNKPDKLSDAKIGGEEEKKHQKEHQKKNESSGQDIEGEGAGKQKQHSQIDIKV